MVLRTAIRLLIGLSALTAPFCFGNEGAKQYVFGVVPYASPVELFDEYSPYLSALERDVPDMSFRFETTLTFTEFESRIRLGVYDFAMVNPAQALIMEKRGYKVVAKYAPDDDFRGVFVAPKNSEITDVGKLAGKTLCLPDPASLAGSMMPLMHLYEAKVKLKSKLIHMGAFSETMVTLMNGKCAAATTTHRHYRLWAARNRSKADLLRVIGKTAALPHAPLIARRSIPQAVTDRVVKIFVNTSRLTTHTSTDAAGYLNVYYEPATVSTYAPVRKFLLRYQSIFGLPESVTDSISK